RGWFRFGSGALRPDFSDAGIGRKNTPSRQRLDAVAPLGEFLSCTGEFVLGQLVPFALGCGGGCGMHHALEAIHHLIHVLRGRRCREPAQTSRCKNCRPCPHDYTSHGSRDPLRNDRGSCAPCMNISVRMHGRSNLAARDVTLITGCRFLPSNCVAGDPPLYHADAVGTRVTSRPPHKAVRAAFQDTAPTSAPNGKELPYAFQRL